MPYVSLQITRGATRAQKEAIVREFTDVLVRVLGMDPRGAVDAAGSEDPANVAAVSTSDDRRPRKMKLLPVKSLLTT
jgi:hypothetical protein